MFGRKKRKSHNWILPVIVIAGTVIAIVSCGDNPSVLDIRNEMIREKEAEQVIQSEQERLQREYLDSTQSIPDQVGSAVQNGAATFSEATKTYTDAAKVGAGELADTTKQKAEETAESIKEAGGNAADTAVDMADSAVTDTKDTLSDLADGIGNEVDNLKDILTTPTSEFGNGSSKNTDTGTADTPQYTGSVRGAAADTPSGTSKADTSLENPPITIDNIPDYNGQAYISINNGVPFFNASQYTTEDYETYSSYDSLGRAGAAQMCTSEKMRNKTERESIGMFKPSGWKQKKYDSIKTNDNPAGYIYNRCHLLMRAVGGNDEADNLITGTRFFNTEAMLPYENKVLEYVSNSNNHVLYRVTPIYEGSDLVARGVLMEAKSMEDDRLSFCVFAYNVQPGIGIDYATGESWEL